MRKIQLLLPLLLISFFVNAQVAKGLVTYKVARHIDKESKLEKIYAEYFSNEFMKSYKTIANEFEFKLVFNNEKAIFYMKDKLYSNKNAAEMAEVVIGHFGRIEQQGNYFITENLEEDFGKFLVKRPYQDWTLHKEESKMIDNYLCFKATTSYTTSYKDKTFVHNFTAWYAPQLPYKYGPIGYGNLPGLIMELQAKGFTYGVSRIEFIKEGEKLKMPRLKKLKLITGEELERLAAIDEERWRKRNN